VERGWHFNRAESCLEGFYRTIRGSIRGKILRPESSSEYEFYVFKPPPGLAYHPHAICFLYRGDDMYHVHFHETPQNIDAGILAIEKVLYEAFAL
jgi:hypothetical protein